jgi:hypothetical protein
MNQQNFLLASQVAEMIGDKWSRQRVHMELQRGTFPEPAIYTGGLKKSPLWTVEQIETFKKERGIK